MSLSRDNDLSNRTMQVQEKEPGTEQSGFIRSIGLLQATAINMTQMCGIGPFITIPIMVAALGGPQAVLGRLAIVCVA